MQARDYLLIKNYFNNTSTEKQLITFIMHLGLSHHNACTYVRTRKRVIYW